MNQNTSRASRYLVSYKSVEPGHMKRECSQYKRRKNSGSPRSCLRDTEDEKMLKGRASDSGGRVTFSETDC